MTASPVENKQTTPVIAKAPTPASQNGSMSVFAGTPGWRGGKVNVGNVNFIGNFNTLGFNTAINFQNKKALDVQPIAKPLLGQFGIGQPAVLAPVNPRPVIVAPLAPMSYLPGKMVLPQLQHTCPKGQILQTQPFVNYPEEPEVQEEEPMEPDQLEHDMTNGDIVGDYPENFSAEQEGEEEQILETEKQMEEAAEQEAEREKEVQREGEHEAVEAAVAEEAAEEQPVEEQPVEEEEAEEKEAEEKLETAEEKEAEEKLETAEEEEK